MAEACDLLTQTVCLGSESLGLGLRARTELAQRLHLALRVLGCSRSLGNGSLRRFCRSALLQHEAVELLELDARLAKLLPQVHDLAGVALEIGDPSDCVRTTGVGGLRGSVRSRLCVSRRCELLARSAQLLLEDSDAPLQLVARYGALVDLVLQASRGCFELADP